MLPLGSLSLTFGPQFGQLIPWTWDRLTSSGSSYSLLQSAQRAQRIAEGDEIRRHRMELKGGNSPSRWRQPFDHLWPLNSTARL
ncbi:MAG TPA: hypothetical protein VMS77_09135 [Conexivisphaerales archaeon]|nr:hypothetical protein [Conexivisphaerales archaeon]